MIDKLNSRLRRKDRKIAVALSLLSVAIMGLPWAAHAQVPAAKAGEAGAPVATRAETKPEASPSAGPSASPGSGGETNLIPKRVWSIVPRLTVAETLTDNVVPGSGVKRSDQITEVSPGIRVDGDGARLRFHLDYQARELLYAQESGRNKTQNYLNSFGTLEAVDNWLFLDVGGIVTQQEISPFGLQSANNANLNSNRVETSNFRASPYIRGKLAESADYEMRYNRSATRSSSALVSDVDVEEWSGKLKGNTALASLGWALEGNRRNVDYSNGRNNEADYLRALFSYQFDREFRVSVSGGQEANNYASVTKETHDTHGYGFDWTPTDRTKVSAFRERRFFGDGHQVSIDHRTPFTVLRFRDSRDVAILPERLTTVGLGSIHDLIFTQLASSIPDPLERSRYVDNLLQQYGIAPDTVVTRGFLTSRVAVQRRQELSYAIQGARNILTLSAIRSEYEGLGTTTGANDIFATSQTIRQRGFGVNWAHRLTPLTTLNMTASQQNSSGAAGSNLATELKTLHIGVSTRLGAKTTASLGARRTLFDSTTSPYSENALIGALTTQF